MPPPIDFLMIIIYILTLDRDFFNMAEVFFYEDEKKEKS